VTRSPRTARARAPLAVAALAALSACSSARVIGTGRAVPLAPPPRPIEELARQLDASDAPSRAAAAWALAGAPSLPETVIGRLLFRYEHDESEPVREAAAWTLGHVPGDHRSRLYDAIPKLMVQTKPRYPEGAFDAKREGTVEVTLLINALGRVAHAEISRSIPEFDAEAVRTVKEWQFAPATRNGRPVPCVALSPVTFRIY
jgi:TonB family protein